MDLSKVAFDSRDIQRIEDEVALRKLVRLVLGTEIADSVDWKKKVKEMKDK